ncbi:MAG: segregation/condensation protein A [Christensenellaceae bacterium]|jgi:segregation and condensation protein A|nr:segregation/condensation protein A [Christensenellaceae bacterium]
MVEVRLSRFQGPLDLLLHLISRAKIDIREIFVSEITEQYLASVRDVSGLDLELASEFLQMAALLLEIKSRSLLPKPPKEAEGEEDPKEALIRRLEEYKRIKEAGQVLRPMEEEALQRLYRLPMELPGRGRAELETIKLDALAEAFLKLLRRPRPGAGTLAPERRIEREKWTIASCAAEILAAIYALGEVSFFALFEEDAEIARLVAVFIAMLELLKAGRIAIRQEEAYGEISITKGKAA